MGLELIESENLPIYSDSRVFNWVNHSYYMTLEDYKIMHRYGDIWEVFYGVNDFVNCERLSFGSKDFCIKLVEHQIRQDELA